MEFASWDKERVEHESEKYNLGVVFSMAGSPKPINSLSAPISKV